MPKWLDLNEVDDDEIVLKKNGMSRSLVLDTPEVADAAEDDFLDTMEPAKKSMTIFFMIDVSGSMKGTKIGSLNSTMEELLPSLIGVGEASTDVKIAIMKFSTDVEWVTPEPVKIEEYQYWNRLEADGLTFMGDAFMELSKKLSRSTFLSSPSLSFAPVIFLLSDGSPNDDWKKGLDTLKQNKWFQHGLKIALGIGSKVNMDVLRAFTGNDELAVQFIGKFNASNLLAVFGAAVLLGKKEEEVLVALSTLHPVAGRFDAVRSPQGITAIVDYAHTPDALINVLNAIHGVLEGKGKVITVVGAGGNRDKGKRPIMAKEAAKASDRVIITSDNPRFEEPQDIINGMLAGLDAEDMKKTLSIADRKEAIRTACMLAEKGDVILVAGKGHENYQEIKGVKHHFDDKEVLKEIFK